MEVKLKISQDLAGIEALLAAERGVILGLSDDESDAFESVLWVDSHGESVAEANVESL